MTSQFAMHRCESPVPADRRREILADPGFGTYFTDHRAVATWTDGVGWHDQRIEPRKPITLDDSAGVLHYAQEIFEGLKAYRHDDDSVWLFRPDMNAARFARSAQRMGMAPLPEEAFLESVRRVVEIDHEWVPAPEGEQSLYLRPFQIASESFLGVRPGKEYTYYMIASPVGAYYPDPVRLWLTPNYTRATWGGTGAVKCGGNYAASLVAAEEAAQHGCGQVMWTDGETRTYAEECGTMNIMFVTKNRELHTPELTGTILPGVTRDSLLRLAPKHGLQPVQRRIPMHEVLAKLQTGEITEVFACGTAAVITPIIGFRGPNDVDVSVGDETPGKFSMELREHLTGIQYGHMPDYFGWMTKVV